MRLLEGHGNLVQNGGCESPNFNNHAVRRRRRMVAPQRSRGPPRVFWVSITLGLPSNYLMDSSWDGRRAINTGKPLSGCQPC